MIMVDAKQSGSSPDASAPASDQPKGGRQKPFNKKGEDKLRSKQRSAQNGSAQSGKKGYTERDWSSGDIDVGLVKRSAIYATHTARTDAFAFLIATTWQMLTSSDRDINRYFTYAEFVYVCGCAFLAAAVLRGYDQHTSYLKTVAGYAYLNTSPSRIKQVFTKDFALPWPIVQFILSATGYVTSDSEEHSLAGLPRYTNPRPLRDGQQDGALLYPGEGPIGFDFNAISHIIEYIQSGRYDEVEVANLARHGVFENLPVDGDVGGRDGSMLQFVRNPVQDRLDIHGSNDPFHATIRYRPRIFLRWSTYQKKLSDCGIKLADPFILEPAPRAALLITSESRDGEVIGRTNDRLQAGDTTQGILFGITRLDDWSTSHDLATYVGPNDGEATQQNMYNITLGLHRLLNAPMANVPDATKEVIRGVISAAQRAQADGALAPAVGQPGDRNVNVGELAVQFNPNDVGAAVATADQVPDELGFKSWYKLRRGAHSRASHETRSYSREDELQRYVMSYAASVWK